MELFVEMIVQGLAWVEALDAVAWCFVVQVSISPIQISRSDCLHASHKLDVAADNYVEELDNNFRGVVRITANLLIEFRFRSLT